MDILGSTLSAFIEKREANTESEKELKRVLRLKTSDLLMKKKMAGLLGIISAGLSILTTQIFPLLKGFLPGLQSASGPISLVFGIAAVLLAVYYWISDTEVKNLERLVQELGEHLSDQTLFLELIQQIIPNNYISESWNRHEPGEFVRKWARSSEYMFDISREYSSGTPVHETVRKLGTEEVIRLIIMKGKSHGIIAEQREVGLDGRQAATMKLTNPAIYNPADPKMRQQGFT